MSKPSIAWQAFCITLILALWFCVVWCGWLWIEVGGFWPAAWTIICAVMGLALAWSLDRRTRRG